MYRLEETAFPAWLGTEESHITEKFPIDSPKDIFEKARKIPTTPPPLLYSENHRDIKGQGSPYEFYPVRCCVFQCRKIPCAAFIYSETLQCVLIGINPRVQPEFDFPRVFEEHPVYLPGKLEQIAGVCVMLFPITI